MKRLEEYMALNYDASLYSDEDGDFVDSVRLDNQTLTEIYLGSS
jgi:hypothetical protein